MKKAPDRGDVVWIDMHPQAGHEQSGRRPALVLSPANYNARSRLALFCPITSQVKGYSFEVRIPEGLEVSGAILADQVKSLDWAARRVKPLTALPAAVVADVVAKLQALLVGGAPGNRL